MPFKTPHFILFCCKTFLLLLLLENFYLMPFSDVSYNTSVAGMCIICCRLFSVYIFVGKEIEGVTKKFEGLFFLIAVI